MRYIKKTKHVKCESVNSNFNQNPHDTPNVFTCPTFCWLGYCDDGPSGWSRPCHSGRRYPRSPEDHHRYNSQFPKHTTQGSQHLINSITRTSLIHHSDHELSHTSITWIDIKKYCSRNCHNITINTQIQNGGQFKRKHKRLTLPDEFGFRIYRI